MDDPEWQEAIANELTKITDSEKYPEHPDRPLPFNCAIVDSEPVEVTNKLSGDSCMLPPDAVAVYDTVQGAELTGNYAIMHQGLEWFRKYFPKEYMILLD
jgi:hypothetical protein